MTTDPEHDYAISQGRDAGILGTLVCAFCFIVAAFVIAPWEWVRRRVGHKAWSGVHRASPGDGWSGQGRFRTLRKLLQNNGESN